MLYRLHNNIFIVGLWTVGLLAFLVTNRAYSTITAITVFAFATQVLLLIWAAKEESAAHSEKELFFTTLIYSILLGGLIYSVFYYNGTEDLAIDDPDAALYYRAGMRAQDLGALGNAIRIVNNHPFDDWGALLLSNFMLAVIPSTIFMIALHMLTGALSAVMLFRIGKHVMPETHAYMAGLAYSTSSFLILFHCTFLKESFFTFLVIAAVYFFYRAIADDSRLSLLTTAMFVIWIVFYRPAVAAFLIVAFVSYYAVNQRRGSAISVFLYAAIFVGIVASMAFMQSQMEYYAGDEDAILEESGSSNYSGGFNFFVGWFASLFGPFPTLFPTEAAGVVPMNLYGAGLMYKLFIVIPLWVGVFFALKQVDVLMAPVVAFTVVEILAAAYVLASFELRKVMLHIPFTYVIAFYGLYQLEKNAISPTIKQLMEIVGYFMAIGVLLLWNVIRVKG